MTHFFFFGIKALTTDFRPSLLLCSPGAALQHLVDPLLGKDVHRCQDVSHPLQFEVGAI